MSIYQLSDTLSVSSQIRTDDIANLADMGFTTIICNRPDGEDFGQPTADEIAEACAERDMSFYFIPVDRSGLTKEMVDNFHGAVTQSTGKVLAYCRSGQRSSMLWQACGSP
jgi:sulfide:quinone oxidoreductase